MIFFYRAEQKQTKENFNTKEQSMHSDAREATHFWKDL
jgi:hypothetical protein